MHISHGHEATSAFGHGFRTREVFGVYGERMLALDPAFGGKHEGKKLKKKVADSLRVGLRTSRAFLFSKISNKKTPRVVSWRGVQDWRQKVWPAYQTFRIASPNANASP